MFLTERLRTRVTSSSSASSIMQILNVQLNSHCNICVTGTLLCQTGRVTLHVATVSQPCSNQQLCHGNDNPAKFAFVCLLIMVWCLSDALPVVLHQHACTGPTKHHKGPINIEFVSNRQGINKLNYIHSKQQASARSPKLDDMCLCN